MVHKIDFLCYNIYLWVNSKCNTSVLTACAVSKIKKGCKKGVKRAYKKFKERQKPTKLQGFWTGKDKNETRNRRIAKCW